MKRNSNTSNKAAKQISDCRYVVIYGYSRNELTNIVKQFKKQLPDNIKLSMVSQNLVTRMVLTGTELSEYESLRFKLNLYHQQLQNIFSEELITTENKSLAQVLGEMLNERELTLSSAESCTGGNIAHKIVQVPGSSSYFLGSVVSYSNDVKADVLKVSRSDIARYGAVSQQVAKQMAQGAARLLRTNCAIATTGIAGPEGGSIFKPVGTVCFAVQFGDITVSEGMRFEGDRNTVMESATNHALAMLIRILRHSNTFEEDINDD